MITLTHSQLLPASVHPVPARDVSAIEVKLLNVDELSGSLFNPLHARSRARLLATYLPTYRAPPPGRTLPTYYLVPPEQTELRSSRKDQTQLRPLIADNPQNSSTRARRRAATGEERASRRTVARSRSSPHRRLPPLRRPAESNRDTHPRNPLSLCLVFCMIECLLTLIRGRKKGSKASSSFRLPESEFLRTRFLPFRSDFFARILKNG